MSRQEIIATFDILSVAGSETVATCLSGATYHLLKSPLRLARLQAEVRNAFQSPDDITFRTVGSPGRLPYMEAVLTESLRIYPPLPQSLPRVTGPEGEIIDGRFVPPHVGLAHNAHWKAATNLFSDFCRRAPMGNLPLRHQLHRPRHLRP